MNSKMYSVAAGLVVAGLATATSLAAQHPVERTELMISNLRPAGQPVLPIFDGWYPRPDGTYDLCFGYFNLNTEQEIDIPLGPDNFIEPAQYDGQQPSHFLPVPPPPNRYRRYFCTFTVNVPADVGDDKVVWTLRQDGRTYSVPGHIASSNYMLEEITQPSRQVVAPIVRLEPGGDQGVGRHGDLRVGPFSTSVGQPVELTAVVQLPEGAEDLNPTFVEGNEDADDNRKWWVKWAKHQGPGEVSFSEDELDVMTFNGSVSTQATFSEPGRYVLRMQAIGNPGEGGDYQFHCCWTNGFVEVDVAP